MVLNIKEIFWRAVKTAVQTFGGAVGMVGMNWLKIDMVRAAALAALTAAISVVWNAIMAWAQSGETDSGGNNGIG